MKCLAMPAPNTASTHSSKLVGECSTRWVSISPMTHSSTVWGSRLRMLFWKG